jgi:hypothetical protein
VDADDETLEALDVANGDVVWIQTLRVVIDGKWWVMVSGLVEERELLMCEVRIGKVFTPWQRRHADVRDCAVLMI